VNTGLLGSPTDAPVGYLGVDRWKEGYWQDLNGGGNGGTMGISNSQLYFTPIVIEMPCTITALALSVTSQSTGSSMYLGVYTDDGDGFPSNLISPTYGPVSLTGTGTREITGLGLPLDAGFYWIALYQPSGSSSAVRSFTNAIASFHGVPTAGGTSLAATWRVTPSNPSAQVNLPSQIIPNVVTSVAGIPRIMAKATPGVRRRAESLKVVGGRFHRPFHDLTNGTVPLWYTGYGMGFQISTATMTGDRAFWYPFLIERTVTFDRVAMEVSTLGAGSILQVALYDNDPQTGMTNVVPRHAAVGSIPGQIVTPAYSMDASTTGVKEVAIDLTLDPALYWVGISASVNCAVRSLVGFNPWIGMGGDPTNNNIGSYLRTTGGLTHRAGWATPSPFTLGAATDLCPRVQWRVAA
jgi:hypothetical protein